MKNDGNRFVVTGAASLVGSHIAGQLLAAGANEVVLFDNFSLASQDAVAFLLDDIYRTVQQGRLQVRTGSRVRHLQSGTIDRLAAQVYDGGRRKSTYRMGRSGPTTSARLCLLNCRRSGRQMKPITCCFPADCYVSNTQPN